jgi:hypothetical protein
MVVKAEPTPKKQGRDFIMVDLIRLELICLNPTAIH